MPRPSSFARRTTPLATCCERECLIRCLFLPKLLSRSAFVKAGGHIENRPRLSFHSPRPHTFTLTTPPASAHSSQLLLDPTVLFAGYKVPHPLENVITIKIQTDERSNPADALKRACQLLISQTMNVKKQFMDQARNIEMGMGPEAAPQAAGGYDPYGDGFGSAVQGGGAAQGGDVYDF